MTKTMRDICLLSTVYCLLTILIWLPHYLRLDNFYGLDFSRGTRTIYQNYDGLEYITIAKSWYNPELITKIPQPLPVSYFPSHFPGYSIFISLFAPIFGYLKSMLFVTQLFTFLSLIAFYKLVRDFKLTTQPIWLSILFLVLPARWIGVHSVGSSESTFIFFSILAIYYFLKFELQNRWYWIILAGLSGALAQLTRPPGILLLITLATYLIIKNFQLIKRFDLIGLIKIKIRYLALLLIPLALLSIFYLFQVQLNDFWAYFHSGDNIHLAFPPYQVFNKSQFWVGDIWLEDIIYTLIMGFLGGFMLLKSKLTKPLGIYVLVFMLAGISIAHRDVSRYLLPIAPFVLIAFEKVLITKEFKIVMAILAIGLYLYTQNFLLQNTAPIPNLMDFN